MPPSGGVSDEIVGPTGPNAPRDCYPPLPIERRWTTLAAAGDDGSVRILFARSKLRNRKVERHDARRADQRAQQPMGNMVDIDYA